jgi:hypothetical protein
MYPLALRQLYYRLIELGIITKSTSNYTQLCAKTAEARRGVDSTFTKESRYPELPIDCFIDDKKFPIGQSDMEKGPRDPTPDLAPTDPYEVTKDAIDQLKTTIFKYDGRCERGSPGFNPGRWYNQPYYVELWVESANLQTTLLRAAGDKKVVVVANGGLGNHPNILKNCERLKKINEEYPDKQIVILYFGDFDSTGLFIDGLLEKALDYHGVENFEVRRVAITPEQIQKYHLIENPEFEGKNKDPRFKQFREKYPDLVEKYGEKFGIQLEALLTTDERLKIFMKMVQDTIDEYWDEDIYDENCPDEEYDYEANDSEEPEDIDPDEVRPEMIRMVTEAFRPEWEKEDGHY